MENRLFDILQELLDAHTTFFRRPYLFRAADRNNVARDLLRFETSYLSVLSDLISVRRTPITITFPITSIPGNFNDAVPVIPTPAQIASELQELSASSVQSCSICQEQIASGGVQLRVCQHVYHRECIQTWFQASCRCPVCRRDIREDPASQTSSDAIETPSQQTFQWGGENS